MIVVFILSILFESFSLSSSIVQFANTLGSVFLGAIDEQCMVCDEDPKQLLTFLSKGTGAQLLLMLNIVGDKVNIDFNLKLQEDNVKFLVEIVIIRILCYFYAKNILHTRALIQSVTVCDRGSKL